MGLGGLGLLIRNPLTDSVPTTRHKSSTHNTDPTKRSTLSTSLLQRPFTTSLRCPETLELKLSLSNVDSVVDWYLFLPLLTVLLSDSPSNPTAVHPQSLDSQSLLEATVCGRLIFHHDKDRSVAPTSVPRWT